MTESIRQTLAAFAESTIELVKKAIIDKDAKASGKLSDSLRYEIDEDGLSIYIAGYAYYVEFGRGAGRFPNVSAIRKWIDDKGIVPKGGISKNSLAYLIGRCIAQKGTIQHQLGTPRGIISEAVSTQRVKELMATLQGALVKDITSELFKTAA